MPGKPGIHSPHCKKGTTVSEDKFVPSQVERDQALKDWKANRAERRERIKQRRRAAGMWLPIDTALQAHEELRGTRDGLD